ncbi:unnamed protein product [Lymnaea stagnalis]|uniref:Uncharacterized protein n=1 Tax=Lymnaea stagnalis TaxID=6523 RepID=A0AAV2HU79_LYMST
MSVTIMVLLVLFLSCVLSKRARKTKHAVNTVDTTLDVRMKRHEMYRLSSDAIESPIGDFAEQVGTNIDDVTGREVRGPRYVVGHEYIDVIDASSAEADQHQPSQYDTLDESDAYESVSYKQVGLCDGDAEVHKQTDHGVQISQVEYAREIKHGRQRISKSSTL